MLISSITIQKMNKVFQKFQTLISIQFALQHSNFYIISELKYLFQSEHILFSTFQTHLTPEEIPSCTNLKNSKAHSPHYLSNPKQQTNSCLRQRKNAVQTCPKQKTPVPNCPIAIIPLTYLAKLKNQGDFQKLSVISAIILQLKQLNMPEYKINKIATQISQIFYTLEGLKVIS